MIIESKQKEYDLMVVSPKVPIKVQVPGGPLISCTGWDYVTNLTETSFKTEAPIDKEHELLTVEHIDLLPISSRKIYKITVLRQKKSNLSK